MMQSTHVHRVSGSMGDLIVCMKQRNVQGGNYYQLPSNPFSSHSRASQARATRHLGRTTKISLFLPLAPFRPIPVTLCSPRRMKARPTILLPLRKDRAPKPSSCFSNRNLPSPINLNSLQYPPSPSSHLSGSPPSLVHFIHRYRPWIQNSFRFLIKRRQN